MKEFQLWKNNKKTQDNHPDYNICIVEDNTFKYIGACWKRESKGKSFLSCKLSEPYNDKKGYHFSEDKFNANGTKKVDSSVDEF